MSDEQSKLWAKERISDLVRFYEPHLEDLKALRRKMLDDMADEPTVRDALHNALANAQEQLELIECMISDLAMLEREAEDGVPVHGFDDDEEIAAPWFEALEEAGEAV